jgi:hypothetical protein
LFELNKNLQIIEYQAPIASELYAPPEAFLGKLISDIVPPDVTEIIKQAIPDAKTSETGIHRDSQYKLEMPQGTRWYELSVSRKPVVVSTRVNFLGSSKLS